jgi:hypothetical protein
MPGRARPEPPARAGLGMRLLWFAALWLAGVAAVAALALLIRAVLL